MDRMDFIQAVVRTRVLEKKLLTKEKFTQLIEASDLEDMWKVLETTTYAERLATLASYHDYEQILHDELTATYDLMQEISPHEEVFRLATLPYDFHNLKVYCKEEVLQTNLAELYLPYGSDEVDTLATNEKTKEKIAIVLADYKEHEDPQRIDLLLDKIYMKELVQILETLNLPMFIEYGKAKIDFLNIRTVLRMQRQNKPLEFLQEVMIEGGNMSTEMVVYTLHDTVPVMIEKYRNSRISKSVLLGLEAYEKKEQLTVFEKEMDNYLMDVLQAAKNIHFGPEPLLAYIFAKEQEIQNLRLIIISKQNGLSKEQIYQRVRDVYV